MVNPTGPQPTNTQLTTQTKPLPKTVATGQKPPVSQSSGPQIAPSDRLQAPKQTTAQTHIQLDPDVSKRAAQILTNPLLRATTTFQAISSLNQLPPETTGFVREKIQKAWISPTEMAKALESGKLKIDLVTYHPEGSDNQLLPIPLLVEDHNGKTRILNPFDGREYKSMADFLTHHQLPKGDLYYTQDGKVQKQTVFDPTSRRFDLGMTALGAASLLPLLLKKVPKLSGTFVANPVLQTTALTGATASSLYFTGRSVNNLYDRATHGNLRANTETLLDLSTIVAVSTGMGSVLSSTLKQATAAKTLLTTSIGADLLGATALINSSLKSIDQTNANPAMTQDQKNWQNLNSAAVMMLATGMSVVGNASSMKALLPIKSAGNNGLIEVGMHCGAGHDNAGESVKLYMMDKVKLVGSASPIGDITKQNSMKGTKFNDWNEVLYNKYLSRAIPTEIKVKIPLIGPKTLTVPKALAGKNLWPNIYVATDYSTLHTSLSSDKLKTLLSKARTMAHTQLTHLQVLAVQKQMAANINAQKPKVVVATHFTAADMLTALRDKGMIPKDTKIVAVVTDRRAHSVWANNKADKIFVADKDGAKQLTDAGVTPGHVHVLGGIPSKPLFSDPFNRDAIKTYLKHQIDLGNKPIHLKPGSEVPMTVNGANGKPMTPAQLNREAVLYTTGLAQKGFKSDAHTVLVMASNVNKANDISIDFLRSLAAKRPDQKQLQIVLVSGNNKDLAAEVTKVQALVAADPQLSKQIKLEGYGFLNPNQVKDLGIISDIVVTKPGGSITAEMQALGKPMALADTLGGQETANAQFLDGEKAGVRYLNWEQTGDVIARMLKDKAMYTANAERIRNPDIGGKLAEILLKMAAE